MITMSYEELERRSKLLTEETSKKIRHVSNIAISELRGLRYSEIEMFLLLFERESKKICEVRSLPFNTPPVI